MIEFQQAIAQTTRELDRFLANVDAPVDEILEALNLLLALLRSESYMGIRSLEAREELVSKVTQIITSRESACNDQHGRTLFCLQVLIIYHGLMSKSFSGETLRFLRNNANLEHISSAFRDHLRLDHQGTHLDLTQLRSAAELVRMQNTGLVYRCCQQFMRALLNNVEQYCSVIESVTSYISAGCVNEVVGVDSLHQLTKLLVSDDHKDAVSILVLNLDFFSLYGANRANLGSFAMSCLDDIAALARNNFLPEYWYSHDPGTDYLNVSNQVNLRALATQPHADQSSLKAAFDIIFEVLDHQSSISETERLPVFLQLLKSLSQILAFTDRRQAESVIYKAFNESKCRSSLNVVLMILSVALSNTILALLSLDKVFFPSAVQAIFSTTKLPPLPKPQFFFNKFKVADPYGLSGNLLLNTVVSCQTKVLELLHRFGARELQTILGEFDEATNRQVVHQYFSVFLASQSLALYSFEKIELGNLNLNVDLGKVMALESSKNLLNESFTQLGPEYLWVLFVKLAESFCQSDLALTGAFLFLFSGLVQRLDRTNALESASLNVTLRGFFEIFDTNSVHLKPLRDFTGVQINPSKNMVSLPIESYKFLMPAQTKASSTETPGGSNKSSTSDNNRAPRGSSMTRQQSIHVDQYNKYGM